MNMGFKSVNTRPGLHTSKEMDRNYVLMQVGAKIGAKTAVKNIGSMSDQGIVLAGRAQQNGGDVNRTVKNGYP